MQLEHDFSIFTLSLVAAIASASDDTTSPLEPFQPSPRDHVPHFAPDPSLVNVPESEFSTSPLIPHSHSQSVVPNDSDVPAPQPSPLPSHSTHFTMPIPRCLWCGTERQADADCCEWSILKGSSNQQRSSLRRTSSECSPRSAWDDTREERGGSVANLQKSVSTLSMGNFGGREGKMNSGSKKDGPMAALQRILSGKF